MVLRPKPGSDPPFGSDRESGCDIFCGFGEWFYIIGTVHIIIYS